MSPPLSKPRFEPGSSRDARAGFGSTRERNTDFSDAREQSWDVMTAPSQQDPRANSDPGVVLSRIQSTLVKTADEISLYIRRDPPEEIRSRLAEAHSFLMQSIAALESALHGLG